jgi:reactive intermediate/imine deaminase
MPKRLSIVLDRVRRKAMTHLAAYGVSDDAYAIVGAMTLGDKTALSDAARETYSVVGVSHVLALSGLHLGIIFMLLAAILIPFGSSMGRLIIGNLVLILSIWAYALMVGMSSSIVRSAVMYTCFAFFGLMSAKPQSLNSLENIKHILEEAGLTMGNIAKTTVFLQDMSLFAGMNGVYATYFDGAFPARSAVAVKALPKDALVEIECIAVR